MASTADPRLKIRLGLTSATAAVLVVLILSVLPGTVGQSGSSGAVSAGSVSDSSAVTAGTSTSGIQRMVDAAPTGGTVTLPAGTFVGQLRIDRSVSIVGAGIGRTILQSPTTMTPDYLGNVFVIEVANHSSVSISDLSVRVTEQCMLANLIGVATGGAVGVAGNSTLDIWDVKAIAYGPYPDLNDPCTTTTGAAGMLSFGRAVSVGLDEPVGDGNNLEVEGHGTITNVVTSGFDIFSISVGGVRGPSGSTATIVGNTVRVGPGPYTAAYGIVAYGVSTISNNLVTGTAGSDGGIAVVYTSAVVTDNVVRNFTCYSAPFPISPPCGVDPLYDDQDLGIFLAGIDPGTLVEGNTIERVDSGILIEGPGAPATVSHNTIRSSTFYGLELIDANQTFRDDAISGGLYAVAVGADASNSRAILSGDSIHGYSVALALLEANSPWIASVVVRTS